MPYLIAIVIPAYHEAPRLRGVLTGIPWLLPDVGERRVIVVDDGSTDATSAVAREAGSIVVRHRVNLGAGAALRTGTEAALKMGADIVVHMDADGQHPPEDLPRLIDTLLRGADAVTGVRAFHRPMPWLFIFGNRFLSQVTRALFGIANPDTQCAYRAFWAWAWPSICWESTDYAFASEMLVRAKRHGIQWDTIPIRTIYLDRYKGTGIGDGVRIFRKLVSWRLGA